MRLRDRNKTRYDVTVTDPGAPRRLDPALLEARVLLAAELDGDFARGSALMKHADELRRAERLGQEAQLLSDAARPVFLCHSSRDKEQTRVLYRRLTANGVTCWFDEEDLEPGQDWDYEISRSIRRSRFVLVCLSRTSATRAGYIQKEIKKALDIADEQPEGVAYIIPARLEECEIPERLKRWHWVDLFKDGAYERLLRSLGLLHQSGLSRLLRLAATTSTWPL